jgi:putative NADH-flavin reductase
MKDKKRYSRDWSFLSPSFTFPLLVQHGESRAGAPEVELTEKAKAAKSASCPPHT